VAKSFEDLRVYCLSEELADAVWGIVVKWDQFSKEHIGGQLVEAADSIGANIAEGFGRGSYQDNRRFVRISRGSLYEAQHFLRRSYRRNLLSSRQVEKLKSIVDELGPRLNAYLRSIGPARPDCSPMTNDK
jgi:four helix bundle protein